MQAARSAVDRLINLITCARWSALCALILCAFAAPERVVAQTLWRGLELGASPNAVRQAFPTAQPPLSTVTLSDGETDDLVTHDFFDLDRFMTVRFFFRDARLTAVMLSPAVVEAGQPAADRRAASDLAAQLTRRIGSPFDCGDASAAGVHIFRCSWLAKPIVIRLWYLDAIGQAPSLRVVYRKADDAAYDF